MLDLLMVENDFNKNAELLVMLEGGGLNFSPTKERALKVLELYKKKQTKVLVCSHQDLKSEIVAFLIDRWVKENDLIKTEYIYGDENGTYNTVEIARFLNENNAYQAIRIVTSPYHEFRVNIILDDVLQKTAVNRELVIGFSHINKSDIYDTNTERYAGMILHEIAGIIFYLVSNYK